MVDLENGHSSEIAVDTWHTLERPSVGAALRNALIDGQLMRGHTFDDGFREFAQRALREVTLLFQHVANVEAPRVRLEQDVQGGFAGLRLRRKVGVDVSHCQTRPRYEPSRVSTLMRSPWVMNSGT